MAEQQHPITPPLELVELWQSEPEYASALEKVTMVTMTKRRLQEIATKAARWGAKTISLREVLMPKNQTVQARVSEKTVRDLEKLSSQSKEFQIETIRKALALYLEAMSDIDNKVLIVNDAKRTQKELILA